MAAAGFQPALCLRLAAMRGNPESEALAANADPMGLGTTTMIPAMDEVGKLFETQEHFTPELLLSGRVAIGTAAGDLHLIGNNLVASTLQGGCEVTDPDTDVKPERFIAAVESTHADIAGLSALLRDRAKVMIGGAPVTRQYSEEIGADGYCESASGVVSLARSFMVGRHAH